MPRTSRIARCRCGSVEVEAIGEPIVAAVCYCDDCQAGSRQIEALPGAAPVRDEDSGTSYVHYRKDRVRVSKVEPLLTRQKLRPDSATNRVVAICCNSAMFIDFDYGPHWIPIYRARLEPDVPPVEMRLSTRFRTDPNPIPDDAPSYRTFPMRLVTRLIGARIAMLFGP